MKHKSFLISGAVLLSSHLAGAVSLSISGSIYSLQGFDGQTIENDSRVEIGYFLGVDASLDPSTYDSVDWGTFTTIDTAATENLFTVFPGGVAINTTIDSSQILGGVDNDIPVRVGVRFFDSEESGRYNTIVTIDSRSILELPAGDPVDPLSGNSDVNARSASPDAATSFAWEDNSNPFVTSIAIPEPGTLFSALVGLGFMASRRKRA